MGKGTFYESDYNLCALFKSVAFFRYKGLKCNKETHENNIYPIYLYISQDSLNFMFHAEGTDQEHQHNYLFEISLGSIDEGIEDVYRGDVKFGDDTLLNKMIKYAYLKRPSNAGKGITFSDLEEIGLEYPLDFFEKSLKDEKIAKNIKQVSIRIKDQINNNEVRHIKRIIDIQEKIKLESGDDSESLWKNYTYPLCRKVFLDFVYDFEIGNAFKDLPNFHQIRNMLHENIAYKALYTKLRFYYLRKQVYDNKEKSIILRKLEELVNTEAEWVNIIINPANERLFHYSRWFKDVEDEAVGVYNASHMKIEKLINKCKNNEHNVASKNNNSDGLLKNVDKDFFKGLIKKNKENSTFVLDYLLQRYSISHSFSLIASINIIKSLGGMTFLLILSAIFMLLHLFEPLCTDKWMMNITLTFVVIIVFFFLLKSLGVDKINLSLFYPRFLIAISSAWIIVGFNADLFVTFSFMNFNYPLEFVLVFVMLIFVYKEVRKLNKYITKWNCVCRACSLLSLGLLYSFMIGIFMFSYVGKGFIFGNEDLMKRVYLTKIIHGKFENGDNLLDIEIYKNIPKHIRENDREVLDVYEQQWNGLNRMYIETLFKDKVPVRAEITCWAYNKLLFTYFPAFFYIMVLLVLFIGIFFELLANDRHLTDPL